MKKSPVVSLALAVCCSILCLSTFATAQEIALADLPQAPVPQQDKAAGPPPSEKMHGGIFANYGSVSVNDKLPPQTPGEKFKMAIKDDFGPSTFVIRAAVAGVDLERNSIPEFHQGAAGYGRYYWHSLADSVIENTLVEGIVPVITHEDTRYYRMGSGGVVKRTAYAVRRVVVIRSDAGSNTFNVSEILGAGAGAGISNLYYPRRERTFKLTAETWGLNVGIDGATFVVREFLPDVMHALFHHDSKPGASH
jgi:hypothetical protein